MMKQIKNRLPRGDQVRVGCGTIALTSWILSFPKILLDIKKCLLGWPLKHESKQHPNENSNILKMG